MKLAHFVLAIGLAAAGCGSGDSAVCTSSSATATTSVSLVATGYSPDCFKVPVGTEVTFTNDDAVARNIATALGQPESFASGNLDPGGTWKHTFAVKGSITMIDILHVNLTGTAIVE